VKCVSVRTDGDGDGVGPLGYGHVGETLLDLQEFILFFLFFGGV